MKKTTKNKENRKMNRRTGAFALALALLLALAYIIIVMASPAPTLNFFSSPTPALDSSITTLNLQSYPSMGENWTVMFNTTGQANLTITPVNNTYFGVDILFSELKCGDEVVNATYGVDDFNGTDASLSSEFQQFHFLTDFENLENEVLR